MILLSYLGYVLRTLIYSRNQFLLFSMLSPGGAIIYTATFRGISYIGIGKLQEYGKKDLACIHGRRMVGQRGMTPCCSVLCELRLRSIC